MSNTNGIPVDENKVIDRVIDIYLWISGELNSAEISKLGQYLIDLANRRASDIEMEYDNRKLELETNCIPEEPIELPY